MTDEQTPGQKINAYSVGMTSPRWWVRTARLQVTRLDTTLAEMLKGSDPGEDFFTFMDRHGHPLVADAFFCAVALRQVLRYADHYVKQTGEDAAAVAARRRFLDAAGEPKLVRDVLEHLDAYRVGDGRDRDKLPHDPNEQGPCIDDGLVLVVGGTRVNLRAATEEAEKLVPEWERLAWKHGAKVGFDGDGEDIVCS